MGDGGAKKEAKRARMEEEARQGRIKTGTTDVRAQFANAFNDDYYKGLMEKVRAAYTPDVEDQFSKAREQMQNALLRSGLGQSSVAARKEGEATLAHENALNDITERGVGLQNQRRQDVAYAENNVLGQLNSTADNQSAFANAAAGIKANTAPPSMPMLGQVFTDLSAGLANQAELERTGQARYNVLGRIPGWNNSSRYTANIGGS